MPTPSSNGNYLIMPLGDSYAAGASLDNLNGNNGYRLYLKNNIVGPNEVHNIQYVGSQVSGTANLNHEGHQGYTTSQVIAGVQSGWLTNPLPALAGPPQFVILTTGSNDFGAGDSASTVLGNVSTLIDLILAQASCVIVTEQILHSGSVSHTLTDNTRRQQAYNALLPGMLATKPVGRVALAKTSRIRQQNLDASGVHPIDLGYQQMEWEIYHQFADWLGWYDGNGNHWMVNRPCPYEARNGGI